ncbi:hypothetical protein [Komagataeibacter xylinus]|uniref:Uncharacterized protein n=1 Tax=Komagataeibacter xylinus TaxID=28448 RepID=A0A857FLM8_KOMXY|nr:hypothetical protein [Komagataeibacter xylinus]QHC35122.1 hypothetical protein FMA36_06030 [Komagataeibacter xylinus]
MIGGATRGKGGYNLWRHLRDDKKQNDATFAGASRGLVQQGITDQIKELTNIGRYASHSKPLYHVHADPAKDWTAQEWEAYWQDYEKEFSLTKQPFSESIHVKHGREHRHRVYSLLLPSGSCLRMDNDHARREKINRLAELRTGETITPGAHNRAVIKALEAEGKTAEAQRLRDAGLWDIQKPKARLKPQERAQQERTHIDKAGLARLVLTGCKKYKPELLMVKLAQFNCRICMGEKGPVVIDQSGNVHAFNRLVNLGSKASGHKRPLKMTMEQARTYFNHINLPLYSNAKKEKNHEGKRTEKQNHSLSTDLSGSLWSQQHSKGNPGLAGRSGRQTLTHRPDTAVARNHRTATGSNPVITGENFAKAISTGKLNRGVTHVASLSHIILITPDYIRDIKARLKQAKQEDWHFYRRAYQNLKDQQYWLDQCNNSIDSNILLLLVELFLSLFFGGSVTIRNKPYPIAMNFGLPAPISDATWNMMSDDQQENILFQSFLLYRASYRNYQKLHAQQNRIPVTFEYFLNLHGKDVLTQMVSKNTDYLKNKFIDWQNRKMDAENAKILQETNNAMTWVKQNNSEVESHENILKI